MPQDLHPRSCSTPQPKPQTKGLKLKKLKRRKENPEAEFITCVDSKVILSQQHILSQYQVLLHGLVTFDAATATQIIYSASSVAERMVGALLVAEKDSSASSVTTIFFRY
jgi:hypothetical protein